MIVRCNYRKVHQEEVMWESRSAFAVLVLSLRWNVFAQMKAKGPPNEVVHQSNQTSPQKAVLWYLLEMMRGV